MLRWRDGLSRQLKELKNNGIEQIGEIEEYEYGRFAWIEDPEGNKIELWEPKNESVIEENVKEQH